MSESHTTARQKWELPDWRDVTAYPRTQDLSVNEWRWEFLRRRQDYRDDFFRPSDKPFIAPDFPGELESPDRCFERQYHLANAMDPRISVAEHKASSNKADKGVLFTFDFEMLFVDVRASNRYWWPWPPNDEIPIKPEPSDLFFRIDLLSPIPDQISFIRKCALQAQRSWARGKTRIINRQHPENWPRFLRVLDARDEQAPFREIGQVIESIEGLR